MNRPVKAFAVILALATCLTPTWAAERAPMILHRGNLAEISSLDPLLMETAYEAAINGEMFLGLTTEDATSKPIPGAAES